MLLRFFAPEYETTDDGGTVTWRINKGLLVAPQGRGKGFLRIAVSAATTAGTDDEVELRVVVRGRELLPDDRRLGLVRRGSAASSTG